MTKDWRRKKGHRVCEDCGGKVFLGDWPTCHGDPEDHGPQTGGWQFGGVSPYKPLVLGETLGHDGKIRT